MTGSRDRKRNSVKRARFANYSGSTSDINGSQEVDRSTPSFNHASSECADSVFLRDQVKLEKLELNVKPIWLGAGESDRFLVLEDADTGDVLMPLSRLKELLGDNYSRSLNNTDTRFVFKNQNIDFGIHEAAPDLYWLWPFESPGHVKAVVRQEMKDHCTGHIRLVPLPVVYNAMSKLFKDSKAKRRADTRMTPSFLALLETLDKALHASSYAPILHITEERSIQRPEESYQSPFTGPHDVAISAAKYMTTHRIISRKKAVQQIQGTTQTRQQENPASLTQLQTEMSVVQDCMTNQAKKLEALEETLQETKNMFSRLFHLFTSVPRPDLLPSQIRECLTDQEMDPACLVGRYSSESTQASQAIFTQTDATPPHLSCTPHHLALMRKQHSMSCLPVMPANQAGSITVHPYPTVASKAHHLGFFGPFTPPGQTTGDAFLGHDKQSVGQSPAVGHSVRTAGPAYGDCMPRSVSYREVHEAPRMEIPHFI